MNTPTTDTDLARERIEQAVHAYDFCSQCGAPMAIEVRDGSIEIACTSLRGRHGIGLLLASSLHDRLVVDLPGIDPLPAAA